MRAAAERLAADLPGVDAEQLVYQRIVQPGAWALAMVRNVRLGQPALSHHGSTAELGLALDRESYPERGSAEDRALAGRLVRLAGGLEHRMAEILDAHGLAALTGDLAPTGNLVPLRRPTSARSED